MEELQALVALVELLKSSHSEWFELSPDNKQGTEWSGQCWTMVDSQKHRFNVTIKLPATYPAAPPEIYLPQLTNTTVKMFKDGRICTESHFTPLWLRNTPGFGIAHALMFGLSTWLNVEIANLVSTGLLPS